MKNHAESRMPIGKVSLRIKFGLIWNLDLFKFMFLIVTEGNVDNI